MLRHGAVVIVGAGQAGLQTAVSLRSAGFERSVVLIGAEPGLPYEHPPLSKALLAGTAQPKDVALRPESYFDSHEVELLAGERVVAVERDMRRVLLESGAAVRYEHLVLATGAVNRRLECPGCELDGVLSLRTLAQALELRERLLDAERVAIVGAGFIGLEVAAVARAMGKQVDVFELAELPMGRVVSEPTARFFARAHRREGVHLHFNSGVRRIVGDGGRARAVETSDGDTVLADVVLVAIGIVPDDELAAVAGLPVAGGVRVDQRLLTPDPAISAIGDCARFPSPFADRPVILESVQNACDQGRAVAARVSGDDRAYTAVPWFWSDQGQLRLQIAGLTVGAQDAVVIGDPEQGRFSALCFAGGRLLGVESVGRPGDHVAARKLLARRASLSPEQARRADFDLKAYARAA
ncbi:MAG: FAD-dependent oxidoreductase [Solirubrobacterales bacterium]|nr:FAD-dependent oxidoreductase [Solirubrobacterales bacterium]